VNVYWDTCRGDHSSVSPAATTSCNSGFLSSFRSFGRVLLLSVWSCAAPDLYESRPPLRAISRDTTV
jgi:hypothetical protein